MFGFFAPPQDSGVLDPLRQTPILTPDSDPPGPGHTPAPEGGYPPDPRSPTQPRHWRGGTPRLVVPPSRFRRKRIRTHRLHHRLPTGGWITPWVRLVRDRVSGIATWRHDAVADEAPVTIRSLERWSSCRSVGVDLERQRSTIRSHPLDTTTIGAEGVTSDLGARSPAAVNAGLFRGTEVRLAPARTLYSQGRRPASPKSATRSARHPSPPSTPHLTPPTGGAVGPPPPPGDPPVRAGGRRRRGSEGAAR